jgi:ribulose-5-phosphate 4-epimerase/fuculose-1-phosphate aldolase
MEEILIEKHMDRFVNASRDTARRGLVFCSSGNLSARIDEQHMLITESGVWMEDIRKNQVALCRIDDGVCLNKKHPSMESGLHRSVLKTRRDINVVLHFQSPFATALACRDMKWNDIFVVPEIPYYIGPVISIDYVAPGSDDLAEAVASATKSNDMVVLRNHGQVTVGKDYKEALKRAVFFEFAAGIYCRAGENIRFLDKKDADFLIRAGKEARDDTGTPII